MRTSRCGWPPQLCWRPARDSPSRRPGINTNQQWRLERIGDDHWKLTGDVEIEKGDMKISADEVEIFTDRDLLTAKGNVTMTSPAQRVSADSLEFNLKTKLGTFHHASGTAQIQKGPAAPRDMFGTPEPDVMFYGEVIEKIGDQKYKLTNGGFTTCVQPSPRWQLTSGSVTLNLDHYAFLTNPVLKVKGAPVFYLPAIYYPINKENRATGFLMPMYGSSTLRGQTLSNAFFWAMGRSHDLTAMYDWFSKTGQGYGAEYRYLLSGASRGNVSFYRLNEKPATYTSGGADATVPGMQSFQIRGDANQDLPFNLKARGRIDYFSSIRVQQTYSTNIYQASLSTRSYGGGLSGSWGAYGANVNMDRSEYFYSATSSSVTGSWPRIVFTRGEKPIGKLPLYAGVGSEFASLVRVTNSATSSLDTGLWRGDVTPVLRFPFTKWPFLTVNSSLAFRYTWWSQSIDTVASKQVTEPISRTYFDMSARIVGPVFNKIWSTPNSGFASKIKHTVQPWVNLQRVTMIDNLSSIVKLDSTDYVIGGTTTIAYGLDNRIYAKPVAGEGAGTAREILAVGIRQTYYTDARASAVDSNYATSFTKVTLQKLSPVSLAASFSPTNALTASFRTEYNTYAKAFLTFGAVGSYSFRQNVVTSAGWSQRRYVSTLPGYDTLSASTHYLNADANVRFNRNRYGGTVSFNYDLKNQSFLQRRFVGYYNPQCCGIAVEFQTFNLSGGYYPGYNPAVTRDRRFNITFTLAGLGTFSNFLGFFGVNQGYR
ncbi:MAG: hypothetical protein NTY02_02325 [Acidobacteria bacterium]|nr:hypothetical protein [Acidobacteriota bacterium]